MELGIHLSEIQLIGKVDEAVDTFVRDTADWKSWWSWRYIS